MKRVAFYCLLLTALATLSLAPDRTREASAQAGSIIFNLFIDHFAISPNGDGVADSMIITYELSDTASTLFLFILEPDSTTIVDTVTAATSQPIGVATASWRGTMSDGSPAPEGKYLVFLVAENATARDSTYRNVSLDVTTPAITITGLFPNPFAPGSPAVGHSKITIDYDLTDPAPAADLIVRIRILSPSGSAIATLVNDSVQAAVSSHTVTWDGSQGGSTEGDYQVRIEATDRAGNRNEAYAAFTVDRTAPKVTFLDPQPGGRFSVVPDSLYGWTWDSVGISELNVRYDPDNPYLPVANTTLVDDTVYFAVPLADSITTEGEHTVQFQSVNLTQRRTTEPFAVTLDVTAPNVPTLVQPPSPTKFPIAQLDGTVPSGTEYVRILRSGAVIDSAFHAPPAIRAFPYVLTLVPGQNRITAVAVDNTGNASAPSNEVVILFENVSGLTIDQPFEPDDAFKINLAKAASSTTLRIYDLGGQVVQVLLSTTQGTTFTIPWDGTNGNFEAVKRGPLVAVAEVDYVDGDSEFFKEIFLFQP